MINRVTCINCGVRLTGKARTSCLSCRELVVSASGIVSNHRDRARKLGLTEHFTVPEWLALLAFYDYRCLRCGAQREDRRVHVCADHVVSLSQGGRNTIDNIQPLCIRCNTKKRSASTDYRPAAEGMNLTPGDLFVVTTDNAHGD